MLKAGDKAPDFKLESNDGKISLKDFRGQKVILYFYPKDNTPGCTQQACDFRDNKTVIKKSGAVVLGVSKDNLTSHEKFTNDFSLPFNLLSDPDLSTAKAYGAYGEKNMYGKKTMGLIRSTFLINEKGVIEKIWSNVKVKDHVKKVLEAL